MKITLRTNHDDWRELSTDGLSDIQHAGHDVPEETWIRILRAAGVQVDVVEVDFESERYPQDGAR